MNAELLRAQRRVEKITRRLEKRLGLSEWVRIEHHFITSPEDEDEGSPMASCKPQWEHREASMKWRLYEVAVSTDDEVELIALHEYVHILVDPIATQIPKGKIRQKLEELAVESVARCLRYALAH